MSLKGVTTSQCVWDNVKVAGEVKGQIVIVARKLLVEKCSSFMFFLSSCGIFLQAHVEKISSEKGY